MNLKQSQYDMCAYLCQNIYYKNTKDLLPNHSVKKLSGLRADIFEFEDETYIVFSGTNGMLAINDWIANTKMALFIKPKQFVQALEFVSRELDQNKKTIICGHSLGGALAEYVCNNIRHDNFVGVIFNGAGVRHLVKPKYENNIYHFITSKDILNRILLDWIPFRWFDKYFKHIGEMHYILDISSRNGVHSHSNWQLIREHKIYRS